jgi:signal peptidase II
MAHGYMPLSRHPMSKAAYFFAIVGGVLLADLLTKQYVQRALPPGQPVPVIGDYLSFLFIENPGVAFGISLGAYGQWLMIGLSLVALVALGAMYRQTEAGDRRRLLAMALIWGGAIGNLIDRVRSTHGVVDFLVFQYRDWQSPVFNIADVAVTSGAILLALALWRDEVPVPAPVRERRRGAGTPVS